MLASLSVKNYALIDALDVNFKDGFSIITGETGAGKSILLGALGLILGNRADLSTLKNKDEKCIVEGEFSIAEFRLQSFFEKNDIDFEERTIIRREILPSGKSRAFVNDTPTTLSVLSELSDHLIDIHSQHQTLELATREFQFLIIDALAGNEKLLSSYRKGLELYKVLNKELEQLKLQQQEAQNQYDYNSFLLRELTEADFKPDEQEFLEDALEKLNHSEDIKVLLGEAKQLADTEEVGLGDLMGKYAAILTKLRTYSNSFDNLAGRMESLKIEYHDIVSELEKSDETIDYSPQEIEKYNNRLQLLYDLQKKHQVTSVRELLDKKNALAVKVAVVDNASEVISTKENEIRGVTSKLNDLALLIRKNRENAIPDFSKQLEVLLKQLEMPHTLFKIEIYPSEGFLANGKDELDFLISTAKGSSYQNIKKVASGGEMSRIMLAIKSILCRYSNLPTIIFDEIDTGVSGKVSNRIASVMEGMSKNMQVIAITHLPQIAAKGEHHYKVYKKNIENRTVTNIKKLETDERVEELAEMLSGKEIVVSALQHAKQLLNQ